MFITGQIQSQIRLYKRYLCLVPVIPAFYLSLNYANIQPPSQKKINFITTARTKDIKS